MITIKTLLIIEDDLSFSSILSNILKKDYSIYLAFSLKQASQILMENNLKLATFNSAAIEVIFKVIV